jgi:hypothetical protein
MHAFDASEKVVGDILAATALEVGQTAGNPPPTGPLPEGVESLLVLAPGSSIHAEAKTLIIVGWKATTWDLIVRKHAVGPESVPLVHLTLMLESSRGRWTRPGPCVIVRSHGAILDDQTVDRLELKLQAAGIELERAVL